MPHGSAKALFHIQPMTSADALGLNAQYHLYTKHQICVDLDI